ncbi:MAG: protein kinase, partial [Scytonema hyalinum WJT4-NPBG1]|nr:protein kinase [Scytonema hyalinum WJT4-NPBG1]
MNSPHSANSWIGRFIGDNQRYRLDQRLGGGGMGDVFLATDMRVGNQVALKLLKDTLVASQEMRKRFEREVSVCAALQSDNIVKISDCGVTPEGFPFYVMEYLRGQTLRHLMLREKQLSVERTVSIMAQVCKGLQLAHQGVTLQKDGGKSTELIKVIHRDLKPDNIFLIPTELGEWVKILDFGVAKIRDDSSEQTNITNITSTFLGTFRYAAPEQIQNDKNLDARADIYSLGIILYEMLSAADPFGLSIKSRNISEASWLFAHSYEPPKRLRSQLGCEHLSSQIEAVVMKCLEKKPNDRFATVEELNQALQAATKPQGSASVQGEQMIVQPQRQYSLGSNDETIARPMSQVEQGDPPDTNLQPQRQYSLGSNNETIARPMSQVEQGDHDAMMTQPRPPATPPGQQRPDGTMMQPRPPATPPGQQRPDGTMMQPRPPATPPGQQRSDGTMMQPRPPATPPGQQRSDGTMMQPRPPATPPGQQRPDGTMMQPRPPATPPGQQRPDGT